MSDYYSEQLVKKKADIKDMLIKVLLIAITLLSVLVVFIIPAGIVIPVIMIVVDVFVFKRLDVEYEYLYVNGELDIDKIMHKEKRKNAFSANVNDVELLAPTGASELSAYQGIKPVDYSSCDQDAKTYELIVTANGEKKRVIFEPNEAIVEGIFMIAPRKVVRSK